MAAPALAEKAGGLPPKEYWLIDPSSKGFELMPTPVDDRRLVLVDELVNGVKDTIDPAYQWRTGPREVNEHHLRWPKRNYPRLPWRPNADNPRFFWNLPPERGILPIEFHNWLHKITEPPPVPKKEVRRLRVESWRVAHALFSQVESSMRKELRNPALFNEVQCDDQVSVEYMVDVLERNFFGVEKYLESLRKIPPDLRFLEPYDQARPLAEALGAASINKARSLIFAVVGDRQQIAA